MTSKVFQLYKVYYKGDGDLSFSSMDQCCCVHMKIVLRFRWSNELSSKHTHRTEFQKGNSFWCFASVQVQVLCKWKKFPMRLPMLPSLGLGVNIQESFMRQMCFVIGQKGVFPSKLR